MKKIYLTALSVLAFTAAGMAQSACNAGRYATDVYSTVTTTSGVTYGSNTNYLGSNQTLTLDVYEAAGDTSVARPLIIWMHGGSFLSGTSTDVDVASLSNHFAKKGYVCASINYRLGMSQIDSSNAILAVIRGVQDLKAAVRFFRKDKATGNVYKVDTNNIFIAGSSAGAIAVLHAAYLKRACQIQPYISNTNLAAMGGLEGTSGNPGYLSTVKGAISLCGALAVYSWLEAGDVPLCSMHGTSDATVIYSRGVVNPGIPLMYLDGSRMIYAQAQAVGVANSFYTWPKANHVPYAGTSTAQLAYMDTTVNFVRDFLIHNMGCTNAALQPADAPFGTATLYNYNSPCSLGIENFDAASQLQQVYPNPSNGDVTLVFANANTTHQVELFDLSGRIISSAKATDASFLLKNNGIAPGVYFVKVTDDKGAYSAQKLVFY
jgi:para-nitrobenzyl esterase